MTQRYGGIIGKDYDAAKQTTTTFTSNGIFTPHTTQDVSFLCVGGGGAGAGPPEHLGDLPTGWTVYRTAGLS